MGPKCTLFYVCLHIIGVSSNEVDSEKRMAELKNTGQSSDYYAQNDYTCQRDEDCPVNKFCEEDTCQQIYCEKDYHCPSHSMENLHSSEIENFIIQCDIYNKMCTRKPKDYEELNKKPKGTDYMLTDDEDLSDYGEPNEKLIGSNYMMTDDEDLPDYGESNKKPKGSDYILTDDKDLPDYGEPNKKPKGSDYMLIDDEDLPDYGEPNKKPKGSDYMLIDDEDLPGVSSIEMDPEKRMVELKNAGQYSDYHAQHYYTCRSDEDCKNLFGKPLSKCNEYYCFSQHSNISCKKDFECPVNKFCEEDNCRHIYCKEDYHCPSQSLENLRENEIENFIIRCDIYNKICTKKPKVTCPNGWTSLATGCYKFINSGNYQQATNSCESEGGFLVEVNNKEEHDLLSRQFYQHSGQNTHIWIGATDLSKDGEWIWGHSGEKITFNAWNSGAPNGGTDENCLEAFGANETFKWNDLSCSAALKGICEYDMTTAPITPRECLKEDNIDYYGNDIKNKKTGGIKECAIWCLEIQECKFWTFIKYNNQCFAKTSDSGRMGNNDAISGTKSCATGCLKEDKIDYYGNNIKIKITGEMNECANWCLKIQECKFWTFNKYNNECFAKTSDSGRRRMPYAISGAKICATGCSYVSLGCWRDTANRAIVGLDGKDDRLTGFFRNRENAVEHCYQVAKSRGYSAFALQDGGWCAGSSTALVTYKKYGVSTICKDGKGGHWANDVYMIRCECSYESLGCWRDTANRAIAGLDGTDDQLTGLYWNRKNAVEHCFQVAKSKGYAAFALQDGGWCAGSSTALDTYKKYGVSTVCRNGKGGPWANDVYIIRCNKE